MQVESATPVLTGLHKLEQPPTGIDRQRSLLARAITEVLMNAFAPGTPAYCHDARFFVTSGIVPITLEAYVHRLVEYFHCEMDCFVFALVYVLRRAVAPPHSDCAECRPSADGIPLNEATAHRLFLAAAVIATKLRSEPSFCMSYYAAVGGISLTELLQLELRLLSRLHFDAGVTTEEFNDMACRVERACTATEWLRCID